MSSEKLPPEPSRPSVKAAERLAVIVDAAERAALSVIDDAEKEAQRYLEEAKARADRIVAERLRETADELEGRSGTPDSTETVLRSIPTTAAPGPEAEEVAADGEALHSADDDRNQTPSEEAEGPAGHVRAVPSKQEGSAAARLLATQMAVSGSSRKEIEMRLRSGFEIEDTGEILDAILGPEE
ncbi:MAG TPA: hypothetical protein VIT85_07380 [Solirubrobacterales bacterium]